MLINTSNNNMITGLPLDQSEQVRSVDNNLTGTKSPYVTKDVFNDTSEISQEAISLYQKEKDIDKYKNMVMDGPLTDAELQAIMDLIEKGDFIDNKELTDALSADSDLVSYLYT